MRRFTGGRGRWFLVGGVLGAFLAGGAARLAAIPDYERSHRRLLPEERRQPACDRPRRGRRMLAAGDRDPMESDRTGGMAGLQDRKDPKGDTGATGPLGPVSRIGSIGPAATERAIPVDSKGPAGPARAGRDQKGDTGATGRGPGRRVRPRMSVAGQTCASGQSPSPGSTTAATSSAAESCPSGRLTFHITTFVVDTLPSAGRVAPQTQNSGPNCSLTVRAPSGVISLIGGTTGVDALGDRLPGPAGSAPPGTCWLPICRSVPLGSRRSRTTGRPARTHRTSSQPARRRTTSW